MMGKSTAKKENYKISVIVPVYNKQDYLEQCIDSILLQTYQNLELLLIDDGSTDESGHICDRYADEEERVRVFHQENAGPTAAVITGLEKAAGAYILFVDSDDYVSKDMLQKMAAQLTGQKGEMVCCNHVLEKSRETVPVICAVRPGVYEGAKLEQEIKGRLLGNETRILPMSRCMKLCEKSIFDGNSEYYDTKIRMGDDFHLMYPAIQNCTRLVMMEKALYYHYRYVEDSIVHGYDSAIMDSIERWYRAMLRIIQDKNIADGEAQLNREYIYMLLYVMKNELRNPAPNYAENIKDIFGKAQVREKIENTPISIQNRANALLYLGMRYPNQFLLWVLRSLIRRTR
ncbi:MAG: glycosyltransferase family 2 protein [Blautia sp.]|nr:glycosyltransferase family 2 protein [Lachnoclostridium sp.]MCM1211529.1 glycosyltransferase family 2 protein [Blautia sp.]